MALNKLLIQLITTTSS